MASNDGPCSVTLQTTRTNDPDQAAALIRRLHPSCDRVWPQGQGSFSYVARVAMLGETGISQQASTAFASGVVRVDKSIRAILVLEGEVTATSGSRQSQFGRQQGLNFLAPEARGSFSDGYGGMAVAVPVDRMTCLLQSMHCPAAPLEFAASYWHRTGFPALPATRALRQAFTDLEQDGDALLAVPTAAAALGDLLAYHLARVVARTLNPDVARAPSVALRRCLEFLDGHSRGNVDLAAMASYANISLRSAQALFARELGTSISAHLRHLRLDRVYQRLEAGACGTIATTAFAEGFTHLGEFGQYYLTRFGERPSDTLRRNRHHAP